MRPIELYNKLSSDYPQHVVDSICCVEAHCKKDGYCRDKQNYSVLDFDEIKSDYYKGQGNTPASVDAICVDKNQKYICFVELKGWKNYIEHLSQQKKTINDTAGGYSLDAKLFESQKLCKQITSDPDLFAQMPTIFLLVTDIDVNRNGIESFADNMFTLAETGSEIYSICVSESIKTLNSMIHIDRDYVFCKNFDEYIASL